MSLLVRGLAGFMRLFALDKRSLALFRVAMGLVTIYDVFNRWPDIHNHYADSGIFPRSFVLDKFQNNYWISFHMLAGTDFYVKIIFLMHAAFALCMVVGYRTRLFTFLNWMMVCSLQNRNYIVCHSGDTIERCMLFWAIFLPIGEVFSLDSVLWKNKSKSSSRSMEVLGVGAMAFTVQIYIMYFTAHFHKSAPEWREWGVATYMALQLDFFRTWVGDIFMIFPWLCKQLTFAVLYWQVTGVLIYFAPTGKYNKYLKAFSVLGFMFMHLSFGMCLALEQFTWATEASLTGAIPGWVWDEGLKYLGRNQKRTVNIYYLTRSTISTYVARVLGLFMLPKTKVIPTDMLPSGDSGIFGISVIDADRVPHNGADALEVIAKSSPLLYPLHYAFHFSAVNKLVDGISQACCIEASDPEYVYHDCDNIVESDTKHTISVTVSDGASVYKHVNKKTFKNESLNMYAVRKSVPIVVSIITQAFLAFLLFLVITWNSGNIGFHAFSTPYALRPVLWVTQLDQYWGMFAPRPPDVMWWYNIEAELDDGTKAELFNDGAMFTFKPNVPHTFDKPKSLHQSMGNHRWFKLFENGLNSHDEREELRLSFGRWLCREYNARNTGTTRLYKYSIHWMNERVDIEKQDGTRYPGQKQTIWNHICYDKK